MSSRQLYIRYSGHTKRFKSSVVNRFCASWEFHWIFRMSYHRLWVEISIQWSRLPFPHYPSPCPQSSRCGWQHWWRCQVLTDKGQIFWEGLSKVPFLTSLIFHQLPTDNTNQNVPFFRTNNCQWPSAVPLLNHAKVMNAPEPRNTFICIPHRWPSVRLWRKVKTVHLCRHLNIVIDTYHFLPGRP